MKIEELDKLVKTDKRWKYDKETRAYFGDMPSISSTSSGHGIARNPTPSQSAPFRMLTFRNVSD